MKTNKTETEKWSGVVLGVNDGLIELTGALVGLSFALQDLNLVALTGLITGIAASLSMAASAFMHARQESGSNPRVIGLFTGVSYLAVVFVLVIPYLVLNNVFAAVAWMLFLGLGIIFLLSWFNARRNHYSFWKEFGITLVFSLGVALITFAIGQGIKTVIPIEV